MVAMNHVVKQLLFEAVILQLVLACNCMHGWRIECTCMFTMSGVCSLCNIRDYFFLHTSSTEYLK